MKKILFFLFLLIFNSIYSNNTNTIYLEELTNNYYPAEYFYNASLYFASQENIGLALVNIKRAYLLKPYDNDIKNFYYQLYNKLEIPIFSLEMTPLERFLSLPFNFNLNTLVLISLFSFIFFSILISLYLSNLYLKSGFLKIFSNNRIIIISIFFLIISIIYFSSAIVKYRKIFDPDLAIVVKDCYLYERATDGNIPVALLKLGSECKILQDVSSYYLVSTKDNYQGWVFKEYLKRVWNKE